MDLQGAVTVHEKMKSSDLVVWRIDLPDDITPVIYQAAMDTLFWGPSAALFSETEEQASVHFVLSTDKQEERMAEVRFFGDFPKLARGLVRWAKEKFLVQLNDDLFFDVIKSILDETECERGLYDSLVPAAKNF